MKTPMKTRFLAAALFLCLPLAALAQAQAPTPSHTEAAEELFATMKIDTLMDQTVDTMITAQIAQNPNMKKVEDVVRAFMSKYMGWNSLKAPMIAIYTETFTEVELREMNAFYRTPTGQKAITALPGLFQKGAAIGQKVVQEHIGELQEAIKKKLEADGAKNNPSPGPPTGLGK